MTDPAVADAIAKLQQRMQTIQQNQRQAQQGFAQLDGMQAEIAEITATASSPEREVTVIAGPGGSISSVRFDDDALRLGGDELGRLVTATIKQAVAESARIQAEVVQRYVGDRLDVTGRVHAAQEQAFSGGWGSGEQARVSDVDDNSQRDLFADDAPPSRPARQARPARPEDDGEGQDWLYDGDR